MEEILGQIIVIGLVVFSLVYLVIEDITKPTDNADGWREKGFWMGDEYFPPEDE